jgi:hypothetical protein
MDWMHSMPLIFGANSPNQWRFGEARVKLFFIEISISPLFLK